MPAIALHIPSITLDAESAARARYSRITDWIDHLNASSPTPKRKRTSMSLSRRCVFNPTSGNIMTTTPPSSADSTLSQERRQSHTKKRRYDISEDDTLEDPEQITPKPHHRLAPSSTAHVFQPTFTREFDAQLSAEHIVDSGSDPFHNFLRPHSNPSSHSSSSCDSATSSQTTRSRSPVKCMADLRTAARPTIWKNLDAASAAEAGGVLGRYQRLRAIHYGHHVISPSLRSAIEARSHPLDYPPACAYKTARSQISTAEELYEQMLDVEAFRIHIEATKCYADGVCEAEWNDRVHRPLLDAIMRKPSLRSKLICSNITAARISPESLGLTHTNGVKLQGKMVDYAVCMQPDAQLETDLQARLRSLAPRIQSINQTVYAPLRAKPIVISIETKLPHSGGAKADVQLATWSGAGLRRTRELLDLRGGSRHQIPTIPTLSIHGHDLHMQAFKEQGSDNIMYGNFRLGGTDTLLGTHQMISAFEELCAWAVEEYGPWYSRTVISST